ncbi:glycosyltransferase [Roseomonas nepalensis]|uniref:Glycosyltransferase n=1 Tax=Muricoccus nepalensis TaxID=1854500 RepID=A0A502GGM8_9PROT|nr:glycosyltransferase [Roseomonas nepalensis]TPG61045.1 glycosyltransferase [Roseomonas nepalensis]
MGRLLVLLPGEGFGEAGALALRVAGAAAGLGVEVAVAAQEPARDRLRAGSPPAGALALVDPPLPRNRGPSGVVRQAQAEATSAVLAAARPDAALLSLPWPDSGAGAMAALAVAALPVLVLLHLAPRGGPRPVALDDAALADAAAMRAEWVAVSGPVAARAGRLLGLPEGRVAVIPPGAERPRPADRAACRAALRERLAVAAETPVALHLGPLEAAKGADRLFGIAEGFAARCGGVVACSGEGILEAALREPAGEDYPLRMLGHDRDPAALLAGADLLVLPSRLEGAPTTFLEAALAGLPVAASEEALEALGAEAERVAALADGDDGPAMARAMAECLDRSGPAAGRAEAARRLALTQDAGAMTARYLGRLRRLGALGAAEGG